MGGRLGWFGHPLITQAGPQKAGDVEVPGGGPVCVIRQPGTYDLREGSLGGVRGGTVG